MGDQNTVPGEGRAGVSSHTVRSVEKAFNVLEVFRDAGRSLSLSEVVELSGLDKSAAQRFTRTLREAGYLIQNARTRQYALSAKVLDLSFSFLSSNELVSRAAPSLIKLRDLTNERVDLSLLDANSLVYLFRIQSKQEVVAAALVGRRVPLFCTAGGRAILSHLAEDKARQLLTAAARPAQTSQTLIDIDQIMAQVRLARAQGFAAQSGEWRIGEIVAASAIIDQSGLPVGAIHIVGSSSEWTLDEFARRMGPLVAVAAQEVSH